MLLRSVLPGISDLCTEEGTLVPVWGSLHGASPSLTIKGGLWREEASRLADKVGAWGLRRMGTVNPTAMGPKGSCYWLRPRPPLLSAPLPEHTPRRPLLTLSPVNTLVCLVLIAPFQIFRSSQNGFFPPSSSSFLIVALFKKCGKIYIT